MDNTLRRTVERMNPTLQLMRCLGTPLLNGGRPYELVESSELLDLAFDNRVELIYLENLRNSGLLKALQPRYEEYLARGEKTRECIARIAQTMDSLGIAYAITKSLRPYPAIPNDTDMLYLGPLDQYDDAVRRFSEQGFQISFRGDMQVELFDTNGGVEFNNEKRGGMFYIDFYRQLAADHVPYMNSAVLREHVQARTVNGTEVQVFKPDAEMAILLLHSIIMHRTIPLEVMWCAAHWIVDYGPADLDRFEEFLRRNRCVVAARTIFGMMAAIYEEAYGEVPPVVRDLVGRFGVRRAELNELRASGGSFPHVARFTTFTLCVLEKVFEWNSFKGFAKQLVMMLNPLFFAEVIHHLFSKARIKKHFTHV